MLLRESGNENDEDYDLTAVIGSGAQAGIEHERELIAVAEAVFEGDPEKLEQVREKVIKVLGLRKLTDAIKVASGFNGITKIANSTGIPLEDSSEESTTAMRQETGIDAYSEAAKSKRYD